ncbi:hypothetical protein [Luteimonas terricola]|uniref:Nuclear transport factor 2 family protein n=1 Tax=Luteimonas terricola TaxID=645597 RepID=A0ABQ2EJS5_9GAMM|nr:hypothetical protein [Luteimonas terricola]GGK13962.1 hypothetical protein GCM10011394_24100 [Luteimonas terricola]
MRIHSAAFAVLALCLAASSSPVLADGDGATHEEKLTPQVRQQLAALRAATARYHDFDLATQAGGWGVPVPETLECLDSASGGMGYHFVNPGNFGVLDPTRPQALIYEPEWDGSMRLVAVEYIVIAPESAPAPVLFDRTFHWNERFQIWALHAWVWRGNPLGVFADYNPIVSCRHAF